MTLRGFWDRATLDRYNSELNQLASQVNETGIDGRDLRVLVDLREHGVQSSEIAAEIEANLIRDGSPGSRLAVIISSSAIHRKQIERIAS